MFQERDINNFSCKHVSGREESIISDAVCQLLTCFRQRGINNFSCKHVSASEVSIISAVTCPLLACFSRRSISKFNCNLSTASLILVLLVMFDKFGWARWAKHCLNLDQASYSTELTVTFRSEVSYSWYDETTFHCFLFLNPSASEDSTADWH